MAGQYRGQALVDIGKSLPLIFERKRLLEEERRKREDDERMRPIREKMLMEQLVAEELSNKAAREQEARSVSARERIGKAMELMTTPQQEPVLPEVKPEYDVGIDTGARQVKPAVGDIKGLMKKYVQPEPEIPEVPPRQKFGDVDLNTQKTMSTVTEPVPYKAPMSAKQAMVESGASNYLDLPEVQNFLKIYGDTSITDYGKSSSVGAELAFTEQHPELVQSLLETTQAMRSSGKGYDENALKSIENLARTRIAKAQDLLSRELFKPQTARITAEEVTPEMVKRAGGTAAAAGEAGTRARIQTEYETKTDIPGSFKQNQYAAGNYAYRMEQSEDAIDELSKTGFDPGSFYNMIKSKDALNAIKDSAQRRYAQAMRNFINATLRRESGAAITRSEFDSANKQYFAQLNDDPETLAQKKESRLRSTDAFKAEAGGAYDQIVNMHLKREEGKIFSGWNTEKESRYQELMRKKREGGM